MIVAVRAAAVRDEARGTLSRLTNLDVFVITDGTVKSGSNLRIWVQPVLK